MQHYTKHRCSNWKIDDRQTTRYSQQVSSQWTEHVIITFFHVPSKIIYKSLCLIGFTRYQLWANLSAISQIFRHNSLYTKSQLKSRINPQITNHSSINLKWNHITISVRFEIQKFSCVSCMESIESTDNNANNKQQTWVPSAPVFCVLNRQPKCTK